MARDGNNEAKTSKAMAESSSRQDQGGNEDDVAPSTGLPTSSERQTQSAARSEYSSDAATPGGHQIKNAMASAGRLAKRGDFRGAYEQLEGTWVKLRQRGVEGPEMDALLSQMEEFGEKQQLGTPKSISSKKYKIK